MADFVHDGKTIPRAPTKDPDSVVDYGCDWNQQLQDSETLTNSSWSVPAGLSYSGAYFAGGITGALFSGGSVNEDYTVTNHVVTSLGREYDRSMIIPIREK